MKTLGQVMAMLNIVDTKNPDKPSALEVCVPEFEGREAYACDHCGQYVILPADWLEELNCPNAECKSHKKGKSVK